MTRKKNPAKPAILSGGTTFYPDGRIVPVPQDDKIRVALVEAKPALDYAKAVREHDAMAAPRAMLATLIHTRDWLAKNVPATTFAPRDMIADAIAQAEKAGIKAED
jgi:hypothetical protein